MVVWCRMSARWTGVTLGLDSVGAGGVQTLQSRPSQDGVESSPVGTPEDFRRQEVGCLKTGAGDGKGVVCWPPSEFDPGTQLILGLPHRQSSESAATSTRKRQARVS